MFEMGARRSRGNVAEQRVAAASTSGAGRRANTDDSSAVPRAWIGWNGDVAHPGSRRGGGGPGGFRHAGTLSFADDNVIGASPQRAKPEHPKRPGPLAFNTDSSTNPKRSSPPARPEEFEHLTVDDDLVQIALRVAVLPDGTARKRGTHTAIDFPQWLAPSYSHARGKVSKFDSPFIWKGKITIQTRYKRGEKAGDMSCYGRGTTTRDVQSGDITLGFHESCHRQDFLDYLRENPLPDAPSLEVGMTVKAFNDAVAKFRKALDAYSTRLHAHSHATTDEVGHKKSWVASKKCYPHAAR